MLPFMEPGLFTVYRQVPTGQRDDRGKPITTRQLVGVFAGRLEDQRSTEGEAFSVNLAKAFIEPSADVHAGDEVEARGNAYSVEGEPLLQSAPGLEELQHWTAVLRFVRTVARQAGGSA